MKALFRPCACAFLILAFSNLACGDDFRSETIAPNGTLALPRVHSDQFMLIRNFTQEDGTTRGVVTVTKPPSSGTPVAILTAAILTASPPDIVNSVIIAGPADVSVTCGDTGNCFISFKKDGN